MQVFFLYLHEWSDLLWYHRLLSSRIERRFQKGTGCFLLLGLRISMNEDSLVGKTTARWRYQSLSPFETHHGYGNLLVPWVVTSLSRYSQLVLYFLLIIRKSFAFCLRRANDLLFGSTEPAAEWDSFFTFHVYDERRQWSHKASGRLFHQWLIACDKHLRGWLELPFWNLLGTFHENVVGTEF